MLLTAIWCVFACHVSGDYYYTITRHHLPILRLHSEYCLNIFSATKTYSIQIIRCQRATNRIKHVSLFAVLVVRVVILLILYGMYGIRYMCVSTENVRCRWRAWTILLLLLGITLLRDRCDVNCVIIIRRLCNTRRHVGRQNVLGTLALDICWTIGTDV